MKFKTQVKNLIEKTPASIKSILAGVFIALSLPPWGWWPLAFLGFALLDLVITDQNAKSRFFNVYLMSVVWFAIGIFWMWDMTSFGYILAVLILSLFFGLAGAVCPGTTKRRYLLPGLIALAELIRWNWPLGGIPLANIALSQARSPLAYSARIAGTLLIVCLTVAIGQFIASFATAGLEHKKYRVVVATVATGFILAGIFSPGGQIIGETKVALVQGGGEQNTRATRTSALEVFDKHLEASKKVDPDTDLIIWPENTVNPINEVDKQIYLERIQNELQPIVNKPPNDSSEFLFGWFYPIWDTTTVNYQSVLNSEGEEVDKYDKTKLVPFGEFVPLRSKLGGLSGELPTRDVEPGSKSPVLNTSFGKVGVLISWEGYFDNIAREAVKEGATILTNPTNGSSYWLTIVQTQQLAANQLHAMENNRWVLQVAPTGISAIIDRNGYILERSNISEQKIISGTAQMIEGRTLANILGFWPIGVYGIVSLLYSIKLSLGNRK